MSYLIRQEGMRKLSHMDWNDSTGRQLTAVGVENLETLVRYNFRNPEDYRILDEKAVLSIEMSDAVKGNAIGTTTVEEAREFLVGFKSSFYSDDYQGEGFTFRIPADNRWRAKMAFLKLGITMPGGDNGYYSVSSRAFSNDTRAYFDDTR